MCLPIEEKLVLLQLLFSNIVLANFSLSFHNTVLTEVIAEMWEHGDIEKAESGGLKNMSDWRIREIEDSVL